MNLQKKLLVEDSHQLTQARFLNDSLKQIWRLFLEYAENEKKEFAYLVYENQKHMSPYMLIFVTIHINSKWYELIAH